MNCPKCNASMTFDREDVNHEGGKSYNRTVYRCSYDNVWVTVEIPVETEE